MNAVKAFSGFGLALAFAAAALAKMYEEPKSFSLGDPSLEQVDRKILPAIDAERLAAGERARGKDPQHPGPHVFAVPVEVAFTPENSGTWLTLPDGRLWRLRIQSPGATSNSLGITRFDMPEDSKLWIYDPAHKHVEGPYTARHRSRLGSLWTPVIGGDEIVVELFVPKGVAQPVIQIGKVNQGFTGFGR